MKNLNEMRKLAGLPLVESVEAVEEETLEEEAVEEELEESTLEEGVRDATDRVLEMIEEGILDPNTVVMACLKYMSEDEVADMAHANEFFFDDEEDDEDLYDSAEDTISAASDRWLGEDDDQLDEFVRPTWKAAKEVGKRLFKGADKALQTGDKALATGGKAVAGAVRGADKALGNMERKRKMMKIMRDPDAYRPSHRASNALSKAAVGGTAAAGLASALDKDKDGPQ